LPFSEPLFNTMEGKLFQSVFRLPIAFLNISFIDIYGRRTLNDSDGTIINTSEAYEAVFIETLRSWLGGMGKAFFSVGPTVPVDFQSGELVKSQKVPNGGGATKIEHRAELTDVELFLENALDKYGKESVIFVRPTICMVQFFRKKP
jgi:hypothetical protein